MRFPDRRQIRASCCSGTKIAECLGNGGSEMSSNQVAVLKREKELLQEILDMAECQPELLESGRAEDLEILLSLRVGPLSQLSTVEEAVEAEIHPQRSATPTTEELHDIYDLNVAILNLVNRIVSVDEKTTEWLREHYEDCEPAEQHTDTD
jgi:hypothetical protein